MKWNSQEEDRNKSVNFTQLSPCESFLVVVTSPHDFYTQNCRKELKWIVHSTPYTCIIFVTSTSPPENKRDDDDENDVIHPLLVLSSFLYKVCGEVCTSLLNYIHNLCFSSSVPHIFTLSQHQNHIKLPFNLCRLHPLSNIIPRITFPAI